MLVLQKRDGTTFTSSLLSNENEYSDKFTQDDGFQLAFAVIDFGTKDFSDVKGR